MTGSIEEVEPKVSGGVTKSYVPPSSDFDSLYGEGGYVFEFDEKLLLKDESVDLTLKQFLDKTLEEDDRYGLAMLGADWAMYNSNYDYLIYAAVVISYTPNGELKASSLVYSFPRTLHAFSLIVFGIWLLFFIYYTIRLFKELWKVYTERISPKKKQANGLTGRI